MERLLRMPSGLAGRPVSFVLYGLFVGGFVAVILFFRVVDIYGEHYFQSGYSAVYNVFRVVFAFYLFWLTCFTGLKICALAGGSAAALELSVAERVAFGFFVGAAVLTAVMLVLGYLNLYRPAVAVLIAGPIVAVSYRDLSAILGQARDGIVRYFRSNSVFVNATTVVAFVAVLFFGAVLLAVKGLYPQGGHDYYLHYFQFYLDVIDRHGIWPNDFWYQYYYSKGLGLTFLAMLLTDPLAPSLVTACYVAAAAIALFSLVHRVGPPNLWPWAAVVMYLALNVHTLGTGFYAANGGWGHFQKPHEINATVLVAILWMCTSMAHAEGAAFRLWWCGAAACSFMVSFLLIVSAPIVGLFCVAAAALFLFIQRRLAIAFLGLAMTTGAGLVSVLLLNFVTTGIPSDIGLSVWWPIIDFRHLHDWGALYDVVNTALRRAQSIEGQLKLFSRETIEFIANVGRIDILGPFVCGTLLAAVVAASWRMACRRSPDGALSLDHRAVAAFAIVLTFVGSVVVFTFAAGLTEAVSYVRITSFMLPVMIAVATMAWNLMVAATGRPGVRATMGFAVPIVLAGATLIAAYEGQKSTLLAVMTNAMRFVGGHYGIYNAYLDQSGWPALPDSRATYPGVFEAWKAVGPDKRLWSFNVHSYCMVPGCRIESHLSSRMAIDRTAILAGTAEQAKAALQREGLNYFFISTYLDIRDVLICTPLFSPDSIGNYLGVKWTNGPDVLLTWKEAGVEPLSPEWIGRYRSKILEGSHTPVCTGNGPEFTFFGRQVADEVAKGKRWGSEIAKPW